MSRPPPRSTLFPTRRSSDLGLRRAAGARPDRRRAVPSEMTERAQLALPTQNMRWIRSGHDTHRALLAPGRFSARSEEHTSELQSQSNLVCRLLLEKKKRKAI